MRGISRIVLYIFYFTVQWRYTYGWILESRRLGNYQVKAINNFWTYSSSKDLYHSVLVAVFQYFFHRGISLCPSGDFERVLRWHGSLRNSGHDSVCFLCFWGRIGWINFLNKKAFNPFSKTNRCYCVSTSGLQTQHQNPLPTQTGNKTESRMKSRYLIP